MTSIMGLFSLLIFLAGPVAAILLLVWVYQMKKNSEILIEQNKRVIELLEKENGVD